MSKMDILTEALTEAVNEAVENAVDAVDIADKVNDAIGEICWDEIVRDEVDFGDLVRENADFDTAAADAIDDRLPEAIDKRLDGMDWTQVLKEHLDIRQAVLRSIDLSEVVSEAVSKRVQQDWEHHQKVTDGYITNKLDAGLNDQISEMVEDRLTGQFHDIDRDLDERVCRAIGPLIDRIQALEAKLEKPWWRRIFG